MNVSSGESSGSGSKKLGQDFDINLAPIIDCFTVLITFLLASASFLALGILDAGAGAAGQTQSKAKPPAITIELELMDKHVMHLKISGKTKVDRKIASKADDWDFTTLTAELQNAKKRFPETQTMTLSAGNDIEYANVIKTMEAAKQTIPAILLGGF